jgi:putative ATP-binding cassette transporter
LLPERPYLPPGTLRDALVAPDMDHLVSDQQLINRLVQWRLDGVLARTNGLHTEQDWESLLSLGEQQLLACVRVIVAQPQFVIFDRPSTALGIERTREVLNRFAAASIAYIKLGHAKGQLDLYDAIVDIHADGSWSVSDPTSPPAGATP